jgi:hypothetical protein
VGGDRGSTGRIQDRLARDLIARRIMEATMTQGERDPERLKIYALEEFEP